MYRDWSFEAWGDYLTRSFVPQERLGFWAGESVSYQFADTSDNQRQLNSVCWRCEFVTGLFFAASKMGLISPDRALVIVGSGPTAAILSALAFFTQIPVIHLGFSGMKLMYPLHQAKTRWICPSFYETTWRYATEPYSGWHWSAPTCFGLSPGSPLAEMSDLFFYGHESAHDVAMRWRESWQEVYEELVPAYEKRTLRISERGALEFGQVHSKIKSAAEALGCHAGLMLDCRFAGVEQVRVPNDPDQTAIYTSIPYWSHDIERWRFSDGPLLISGSGDGALQDFLRAVWSWDELEQGRAIYHAKFWQNEQTQVIMGEAVAEIEMHRQRLRALFDEWDEARLEEMQDLQRPVAELLQDLRQHQIAAFNSVQEEAEGWAKKIVALLRDAGPPERKVYLHTKDSVLGPCYLHNLLFTAITLQILRRHYEPKIITPELKLQYDVSVGVDRENAFHFEGEGRVSACGMTGLDFVLLRHGPRRLRFQG